MNTRMINLAAMSLLIAACSGGSDSGAPTSDAAPTLNAVADQTTGANQSSMAIAFTVADEQVDDVVVVASSDNQSVVPDDGLAVAGSGSARTLTVSPAPDTLGNAFITLVATDVGNASANATFLLTVEPQQKSLQQFTRATFQEVPDEDPAAVNAVEFLQDADEDDFADLLSQ